MVYSGRANLYIADRNTAYRRFPCILLPNPLGRDNIAVYRIVPNDTIVFINMFKTYQRACDKLLYNTSPPQR